MSEKMNHRERRAVISLSGIMSLRMIGLFMVIPLFALYAKTLQGATPTRIGLALGIYGLSQALLQIPLGMLSDRVGRKPIILLGLSIFILGSGMAAFAPSITWLILGRALQGAGAVGSTILAMIADMTRETQRTKAMAIAGISIGLSFALAMLVGPFLSQWLTVRHLFCLAMLLGVLAIILLQQLDPDTHQPDWHGDTEPELKALLRLMLDKELIKLNLGIFVLHAVFTASFIVIPVTLDHFVGLSSHEQWVIYLPILLVALIASLIGISVAERMQKVKPFFLSGIMLLGMAECCLWATPLNTGLASIGLSLFFLGFTLLEAFLPSLVSRTAPVARKGSALGLYSCAQFLGIFIGGLLGGWLYGQYGLSGVYLLSTGLAFVWLALAFSMHPPRYLVTQYLRIAPSQQPFWETIAAKIQHIPGVVEVTLIAEENLAYLKMERTATKHADFIRLKEELQSQSFSFS